MKKINLIFQLMLLFSGISFSQQETHNWYFGSYAGLNFAQGEPVILSPGAINTEEGVTCVSDSLGKLLFYSDGITVWNGTHDTLRGGTDLKGSSSSTSSALTIPIPGKSGNYLLFTLAPVNSPDGLCYTRINLNDTIQPIDTLTKNTLLRTNLTEKMIAARHSNGRDYWLITHGWNDNRFFAYLIDNAGVHQEAIVSSIGTVHGGDELNAKGCIKVSPDGKRIGVAIQQAGILEVLSFNASTGQISAPFTAVFGTSNQVYGLEFSPKSKLIYFSMPELGEVYQINLEKFDNSRVLLGKTNLETKIGALQIASNGRIYFTQFAKNTLGMIPYPDRVGRACGYINEWIDLEQSRSFSTMGLPTFIYTSFTPFQDRKEYAVFTGEWIKTDQGAAFVFKDVHFGTGETTLKSGAFNELNQLVKLMMDNPELKLSLFGHTDDSGDESENIVLSEKRAFSIFEYLTTKGVSAGRIKVFGRGSTIPVASNETEEGRMKNRRVELILDTEF